MVIKMNNYEVKKLILDKIKEYKKIILVRHIRPDGDCVGGTIGFRELLKASFPDKEISVISEDYAQYLAFVGEEDEPKDESYYSDSLVIALDTATSDRISNKLYSKGKELIKIDHHIEVDVYGDINWVEDSRASLCEMLVDFYVTFKDELVLNESAAKALYIGIITDSGRFKFSSVSGETLRLASILLDSGINVERIYSELYLKDLNTLLFESEIMKKLKITENGVAYIYIDKNTRLKHNLSMTDASAMISVIENIRGSIIWIAFIENDDMSIRVRLRSRFVTVDKLANRYHGGGHDHASGATVYSRKEMNRLLKDADALIKSYKESNSDWL